MSPSLTPQTSRAASHPSATARLRRAEAYTLMEFFLMTTNCKTSAPPLHGGIGRDMLTLFCVFGLFGIIGATAALLTIQHRSNINASIQTTISDPTSLDRVNAPNAQWHGQISWPLGYQAALLCGPDDFGRPRAVVAKVYDGMILDELWADGRTVLPEVTAICAAALKRKGKRA